MINKKDGFPESDDSLRSSQGIIDGNTVKQSILKAMNDATNQISDNVMNGFKEIEDYLEFLKDKSRFFLIIECDNPTQKEILTKMIEEKNHPIIYSRSTMYSDEVPKKVNINIFNDLDRMGLSIISLPRDKKGRFEREALQYLNIHRDLMLCRELKLILFLENQQDSIDFREIAGDLWDFRTRTLFIEK